MLQIRTKIANSDLVDRLEISQEFSIGGSTCSLPSDIFLSLLLFRITIEVRKGTLPRSFARSQISSNIEEDRLIHLQAAIDDEHKSKKRSKDVSYEASYYTYLDRWSITNI